MHARTKHEEIFDIKNFKITLVKKCSPQTILMEEFKSIDVQNKDESIVIRTSVDLLGIVKNELAIF